MFAGVTWHSCICSISYFATLTSAALYSPNKAGILRCWSCVSPLHLLSFPHKPNTCFVSSMLTKKATEAVASADLTAFLSHYTCGSCHREWAAWHTRFMWCYFRVMYVCWRPVSIRMQHDTQDAYGATSESWMFDGGLQCQWPPLAVRAALHLSCLMSHVPRHELVHTKEDLPWQSFLMCTGCWLGTWPRKVCYINRMYCWAMLPSMLAFKVAKMDLFENGSHKGRSCFAKMHAGSAPQLAAVL